MDKTTKVKGWRVIVKVVVSEMEMTNPAVERKQGEARWKGRGTSAS